MRKNYFLFILAILFTVNAMAQNIPSYVPKDGLVGYWPFNGNANDESGKGNHGTVNGATLTADRNGVANSAYIFKGGPNEDANDITMNNPIKSDSDFSICYWMKANFFNCSRHITFIGNDGDGFEFMARNDSSFFFRNWNGTKSEPTLDLIVPLEEDLKNNNKICLTYNHDLISFYINGTKDTFVNFKSIDLPIGGFIKMGRHPFFDNNELTAHNGTLDDITIFNRALSDQEITALYTGNPIVQNIPSYVPKDGLVGYWPFNGNANDESGNGNHGTVNGTTLSSDRNGVANSAYDFDGKSNYILIEKVNEVNNIKNLTVSFWLTNHNDACNQAYIITEHNGSANTNHSLHYGFRGCSDWGSCPNGGCMGMDFYSNIIATSSIRDSLWSFWSLVYDETNSLRKIYKNNELLAQDTLYSFYESNFFNGILIGAQKYDFSSIGHFYKGQLDDISIYNRALSDQEIKQLYEGCSKETATSSSFNSLLFTNGTPVSITAEPQGGVFSGSSIENNLFIPSKAKIGSNKVKYNFKNSQGCLDSSIFNMVVADTVGANCTKYDTVIVNKTKYDTVTVTNNVTKYDTLKVTKFDTVTVKNNVFDTVKVTKYDTLTVTNNVTKYDTVIINKTKFDTVIVKTNVFDTVKVTKYDTLTITKNVTKYDTVIINKTKYDTVIVNKTKYDTITIKNNVFDTVKVTKYDTLTVKNNIYDTVSILKIKFKLTTGISANQLSSLSIYPNPTSDVLHIEVPDAKALEGYRYRIVDVLGKEVYNQLVTQTTTEIPLKTLGAAGIYQFEILDTTKTSIQSNKIVLQ